MRRTCVSLFTVFAASLLAGCISIPEPRPMQTLTYEYDKDKQQWTKAKCVVSTRMGNDEHSIETVCRGQIINAPPVGIEKRVTD
jgi:hypothetical protein